MGRKNKKRTHAQFSEDNDQGPMSMGVGATLDLLRGSSSGAPQSMPHEDCEDGSGEWQTVGKGGKKQKKKNYPTLTYSESYRMQSAVKLGDLQSLVLYCLADGTSPQWVAVRHHNMIKKAVVLFVPGLEKGMFDGSITLKENGIQNKADAQVKTSNGSTITSHDVHNGTVHEGKVNVECGKSSDPDDFLPTKLDSEHLPSPLKPLANTFSHLWPVKSPGDDRLGRVFSPLSAILQCPLSKSQEEKRAERETKAPKAPVESRNWENKRTRISEFVLSSPDLQENDYVLHPANFELGKERENFNALRIKNGQSGTDSWVDSHVENFEDSVVPENKIEQCSITAGREIYAMDCEMCKAEGNEFVLTRLSLVNWNGEKIIDELVKPEKPVIDYLTP